MNETLRPLNRQRVEVLGSALLKVVRAHYFTSPRARSTVFEQLNALAVVTASVIAGCQPDDAKVRAWFDNALSGAIDMSKHPDAGTA